MTDDYRRLGRSIVDSIRLLMDGLEDDIRFEAVALMVIPERASIMDTQHKKTRHLWWNMTRKERRENLRDRLDHMIRNGSLGGDTDLFAGEACYRVVDSLDRLSGI